MDTYGDDRSLDMFRVPDSIEAFGHQIEIRRKAGRRSMGLTVHVSGRLRVSAPKSVSLRRIVAFVESQRDWIETNLARYSEVRERHPKKILREGERFPLLGVERELVFACAPGRTRYSVRLKDSRIVVEIPEKEWETFDRAKVHRELRPLLQKFYQKAGREIITTRIERMSKMMDLHPTAVTFRSQKTRWGSCSSKGRISMNWRLVVAPLEVVDYVVAHELAHLKHYDHSASFWSLVESHVPDYRSLRRWLRDHVYDADFLAARSELHA